MNYQTYNAKKISSFGVKMITFASIATMSSITPTGNVTTSLNKAYVYEGVSLYNDKEGDICSSFGHSEGFNGDVVASGNMEDEIIPVHEKVNVKLKVLRVKNHVSEFDFEEEYEEI